MSYQIDLQNQIWELDGVSQQSTESYKRPKKAVVISKFYNQNSSPKLCEEKKILETIIKQNVNRQNKFGLYLKAR